MLRGEWQTRRRSGERQPMTEAQARVIAAWLDLKAESGQPPTLAEVGAKIGRSARTVQQHCFALQRRGWITYREFTRRGILLRVSDEEARDGIREARKTRQGVA